MKKVYRLPIIGKVLKENPLTGDESDPICSIPLNELPNYPIGEGHNATNLEYNIDEEWCEVRIEASEEFHNWLSGVMPQIRDICSQKGWKLDKTAITGF